MIMGIMFLDKNFAKNFYIELQRFDIKYENTIEKELIKPIKRYFHVQI